MILRDIENNKETKREEEILRVNCIVGTDGLPYMLGTRVSSSANFSAPSEKISID